MWDSGLNIPMFSFCVNEYEYLSPDRLGAVVGLGLIPHSCQSAHSWDVVCLGRLILCVVGDSWAIISPVVTKLLSSCGGYRVFGVSSGVVTLFLGLIGR